MSRNKYVLVDKFFHVCSNRILGISNDNDDPIRKIRPFIDKCNFKFSFCYPNPSEFITVDETMVKFQGRVRFLQYIQNKPVRYGIKLFLVCDSFNGYCLNSIVYTGKNTTTKLDSFSATDTVVIRLIEKYLNLGKTLFVDNYFTSKNLIKYLIKKKTYLVGTMKKNRIEKITQIKTPEKNNFSNYYNTDDNYIITVYNDKKVVYLANSKEVVTKIEKVNKFGEKKTVPSIIMLYNRFSRGVDISNRSTTIYRYPHRHLKWWKPLFFHYIQIIINNSFILSKEKGFVKCHKDYYMTIIRFLIGDGKKKINKTKMIHQMEYINIEKKSYGERLQCEICKKRTIFCCRACNLKFITPLCFVDCFNSYHNI